jgi:hypothetical protein
MHKTKTMHLQTVIFSINIIKMKFLIRHRNIRLRAEESIIH